MTRFLEQSTAAVAAVLIVVMSMSQVVAVPPAQADTLISAPALA